MESEKVEEEKYKTKITPHKHHVVYKSKSGKVKRYEYTYGKVTKNKLINKIRKR